LRNFCCCDTSSHFIKAHRFAAEMEESKSASKSPAELVKTQEPGNPETISQRLPPYATPVDDIFPFLGLGFITFSIYLNYPQAVGCSCFQTTLCCTSEQQSCVLTDNDYNPLGSFCVGNRTECHCFHPIKTFTKFQFRFFSIDGRFALPGSLIPPCGSDPEHPAIINLLGFTFFYGNPDTSQCTPVMVFAKSIREIKQIVNAGQPAQPAAPAQTTADAGSGWSSTGVGKPVPEVI
jgi:hypothetical protein